jgi:inner membrane transporter RhtA
MATMTTTARRVPAPAFLVVSAVFHYLGPAFAVLLFARLDVLGVAWVRIASAAALFALWRRPWRALADHPGTVVALGVVLALMNSAFYLAIDRLALSTVGAVEFLGVIVLAAAGVRTPRNGLALLLAVAGVYALTDVRLAGEPLGFAFAFVNCALFMLYIALGHRIANADDGAMAVDRLAAAMLVATVAAAPIGLRQAVPAFTDPAVLAAGIAVGVCSSVVPYVADQLAMARLRRTTFALMLSLLPATATVVGLVVLDQTPTARDLAGIGLVVVAVAIHEMRR